MTTANRSHVSIRVTTNFGQGRWRVRPCKIFLSINFSKFWCRLHVAQPSATVRSPSPVHVHMEQSSSISAPIPDIYYFQNTPEVTSVQLILSFSLTVLLTASLTIFVRSPWSRLCCIRLFKFVIITLHYITSCKIWLHARTYILRSGEHAHTRARTHTHTPVFFRKYHTNFGKVYRL